jgi:hypothetical protein
MPLLITPQAAAVVHLPLELHQHQLLAAMVALAQLSIALFMQAVVVEVTQMWAALLAQMLTKAWAPQVVVTVQYQKAPQVFKPQRPQVLTQAQAAVAVRGKLVPMALVPPAALVS